MTLSRNTTPVARPCPVCDDDGWIEVDALDDAIYAPIPQHCPHLVEPWHRPFNHTGLLDGMNGILERLGGPDA